MVRATALRLLGALVLATLGGTASSPAAPGREGAAVDSYLPLETLARQFGLRATLLDRGESVRLVSGRTRLEFTAGSREAVWNGYRLFLGEPVELRGRSLAISPTDWIAMVRPLIDPKAMQVPGRLELVVIDPGHGGSDPGTENAKLKLKEKTFTLDVAKRLKRDLEKRGYRVLLTRSSDTRLKPTQIDDLRARVDKANKAGADLFISLHFNSLPDAPTVRGVETYALTPAGQRSTAAHERQGTDRVTHAGNRNDHWNMVLAGALHHNLMTKLATTDRGVKHARFAVLRPIRCPAALVEGGFLSNPAEAQKIKNAAYRQKIAEAIGDGVGDYALQLRAAAMPRKTL